MISTFYSYKGGVGRTMALANVAELFYRKGLNVLLIDWDLEAPGLEQFFFPKERLEEIRQRRGIIDLLSAYKEQMTRKLDLSDPHNLPFESPREVAHPVYPENSSFGQLRLITAGRRSPEEPGKYAETVLNFDWQDFYANWQGEAYFNWFRLECNKFADVVLLDSRTGVTEMGGVCTYHLSDIVVMFCAGNNQNIQGTRDMLQNLSHPGLIDMRGGRPLRALIVPSRVDTSGDTALVNEFSRKLSETLTQYPQILKNDPKMIDRLLVPYVSSYGFEERLAVTQPEGSDFYSSPLIGAYERLAERLNSLGRELHEEWERKLLSLKDAWEEYGRKFSELKMKQVFAVEPDEREKVVSAMEQIEKQRRAIEQEQQRLQQEFHYYRVSL